MNRRHRLPAAAVKPANAAAQNASAQRWLNDRRDFGGEAGVAGLARLDIHTARDVTSCPGADTCNLAVTSSRTVADAIAMHESTVSRVTANKYMATNRGLFELKYFFTSGVSGADGEGVEGQRPDECAVRDPERTGR